MLINKDDELVGMLESFLSAAKTPECSTVVAKTIFYEHKGVKFTFSEGGIEKVNWYTPEVDFCDDICVDGSFFISLLLSEIKKNGKAELTYSNGKLVVNGKFEFATESPSTRFDDSKARADITFTREQFDKLKEDSIYTVGNYCFKPKSTDVVGFACNEGKLYKLLPGIHVYKIGFFDAVIDEVSLSQNYGHTTKIWLLPRKVIDIVAGDNITIQFNDEDVIVCSNKMKVIYNISPFGTNSFKKRVAKFADFEANADKSVALSVFKKAKIEDFFDFSFFLEEDKSINVKIEANKMFVSIDNCSYTIDDIESNNFSLCTNMAVLNFLLKNCSAESKIIEQSSLDETDEQEKMSYVIFDNGELLFIPKISYLY